MIQCLQFHESAIPICTSHDAIQFKINHNILYTESRLFRDTITDNDKCYLCSGSQTLRHLFADCDFSKVFWVDFISWWNYKNNTQIVLQPRNILFAFNPGKKNKLGTDKRKIRDLVTL